jgi:MFS family permease
MSTLADLLSRKINELPENTPGERARIYLKARQGLHTAREKLLDHEYETQTRNLEVAIGEVEAEYDRKAPNRWSILCLLFGLRFAMAFQFQSVASVAPLVAREFDVGLGDVGTLIGLYFAPGVVLALLGGAIGERLGDKATVIAALIFMAAGSITMGLSSTWPMQIAGRVAAGAGGVVLTVQLTKMTADWFSGREIATAMAIFVNSWPAGIALSLLTMPLIAASHGVSAVHFLTAAVVGFLAVVALLYRSPAAPELKTVTARLAPNAISAIVTAGMIWGLFNVGFAMIFSFGPAMLVERGWSIAAAGAAMSIIIWVAAVSVPLGGILADQTKRPQLILVIGCIAFAALMLFLPRSNHVVLAALIFGLISGLPAGPIMSLPAQVLPPASRTVGMSIFFAVYYACMLLGPALGGKVAEWFGSAAAFDFGAGAALLGLPFLIVFNHLCKRSKAADPTAP